MPRPTRRRAFLAPAAGLIVFNRISVLPFLLSSRRRLGEPEAVAALADHSARRRRVDHVHRMIRPLESQPAHGRAMILLAAIGALHQRDLDLLVGRHDYAPVSSSTVIPRLAAISAGEFTFCNAFNGARTRVAGFLGARHL